MLTIKVNPAYIAAKFPTLSPTEYSKVLVPLEDISFNGVNTPIFPDPRGRRTVDGWMKSSYEGNTHGVMVDIDGVLLEEQSIKTASSGVGGNLANNMALGVQRGTLLVYNAAGALLTANDLITSNF
jgi:hypothetical protein